MHCLSEIKIDLGIFYLLDLAILVGNLVEM